jgi:hypothetical protein
MTRGNPPVKIINAVAKEFSNGLVRVCQFGHKSGRDAEIRQAGILVRVLAVQTDMVELNVLQLLRDAVAPEECICRTFIIIVGEKATVDLRCLVSPCGIADRRE